MWPQPASEETQVRRGQGPRRLHWAGAQEGGGVDQAPGAHPPLCLVSALQEGHPSTVVAAGPPPPA